MGFLNKTEESRQPEIQVQSPQDLPRSSEIVDLLNIVVPQLITFVRKADLEVERHESGTIAQHSSPPTSLVRPESTKPRILSKILENSLSVCDDGLGQAGLEQTLSQILEYSVNPCAPGFMDKLTAAPLPPGIVAELILSLLNTNLHVYRVSPVLTLIEVRMGQELSKMFGLCGPRSGGISCQGGSASNLTSIVVARNTLYPVTKSSGNSSIDGQLTIFTSSQAHYNIQKAAQVLGLGGDSVVSVPVDRYGRMNAELLESAIKQAKEDGRKPFYISATAGTTVLGAFDPFEEISKIACMYGLWLHVDAAWGGGFVFSEKQENKAKLRGVGMADSIAVNAHKMLGVPMTCSFLLGKDMRQFQESNTIEAGYLFHPPDGLGTEGHESKKGQLPIEGFEHSDTVPTADLSDSSIEPEQWQSPDDLAEMTLQCGRRGDSLKFFLSWQYYGTRGYAAKVDHAHSMACYLSTLVDRHPDLSPVLCRGRRPDCLQICFYYTPRGLFMHGLRQAVGYLKTSEQQDSIQNGACSENIEQILKVLGRLNSKVTIGIAGKLIDKGFMIDHAPPLQNQVDKGSFFRAVVNISTSSGTLDRLVESLIEEGEKLLQDLSS